MNVDLVFYFPGLLLVERSEENIKTMKSVLEKAVNAKLMLPKGKMRQLNQKKHQKAAIEMLCVLVTSWKFPLYFHRVPLFNQQVRKQIKTPL